MIELAYEHAEAAGIVQLNEDEAGPYQAIPQPGADWHLQGHPKAQPHEYVRGGTAKLLTLFRPATGLVRAKGVLSAPNAVLHPWLQEQLQAILAPLEKDPLPVQVPLSADHPLLLTWQHWWWSYERPKPAPALRLILVWDNLAGHLSYCMVRWLLQHGILPLYTPLSGSWLNMAESLQRIIVRRALSGQHPETARAAHRLAGADGGGLEYQSHGVCVEWQAATPTRTRSSAPPRRLGGCRRPGLLNCRLTH